jgi:hypothetical protein
LVLGLEEGLGVLTLAPVLDGVGIGVDESFGW